MESKPDGANLFFSDFSNGQLVTGLNMTLLFNSILTLSLCLFVLLLMKYTGKKAILVNGDDHCVALPEQVMQQFFTVYQNFLSPLGFKGYGEASHAEDLNFCSQEMYRTKEFSTVNVIKTPVGNVQLDLTQEWIMDWEPFRGQKCLNYNTLNPIPFSTYVPQFLKSIKHHSSVPWFRDSYNEAVALYGCADELQAWYLRKFPHNIYTFNASVHWELDEEWWVDAAVRRYGSRDRHQAWLNVMNTRDLDKWLYYDTNLLADRTEPKEKFERAEEMPIHRLTKEKGLKGPSIKRPTIQLDFYDHILTELYGVIKPEKFPSFVDILFK